MITRRQFVLGAAALPLSGQLFAAQSFTAGKEYLVVTPSAPTSRDKIEVVLFFAYTCSHCLQFEPHFAKWAKTAPADVAIRICPIAWQPKLDPFTQTYFSLEALGLVDKLSMPFFESVPTILKTPRPTSLISWPRPALTVKSGNKRCAPSA